MVYNKHTREGKIVVNENAIAQIAGGAAMECYGVVGMASKRVIFDGFQEILGQENYARGVEITEENGLYHITLHVILAYAVKATIAAEQMKRKVRYELEKSASLKVGDIEICIVGISYEG
jgi:uncharacterized alkaline shock family protein YloU